MRFGLKDVNELPSMEEFEKLVAESFQAELIPAENAATEAAFVSTPAEGIASETAESESSTDPVQEAQKAG